MGDKKEWVIDGPMRSRNKIVKSNTTIDFPTLSLEKNLKDSSEKTSPNIDLLEASLDSELSEITIRPEAWRICPNSINQIV